MNRPVLVLNANYEPLNVCSTKRAIGLVMLEKAVIVANGRGYLRTPSTTFLRPSIIRLGYMVHRPRPRVKLTKQEIFQRDGYTCQYCGRRGGTLTIDHITPRYKGGGYSWTNLVTACSDCNRKKGGKTPGEANMMLIRQPFEPTASARYLYGRYLQDNQDWQTFIGGW